MLACTQPRTQRSRCWKVEPDTLGVRANGTWIRTPFVPPLIVNGSTHLENRNQRRIPCPSRCAGLVVHANAHVRAALRNLPVQKHSKRKHIRSVLSKWLYTILHIFSSLVQQKTTFHQWKSWTQNLLASGLINFRSESFQVKFPW